MARYYVSWEIDVENADSPIRAAEVARGHQRARGSTATVFDVMLCDEEGMPLPGMENSWTVDLTENTVDQWDSDVMTRKVSLLRRRYQDTRSEEEDPV